MGHSINMKCDTSAFYLSREQKIKNILEATAEVIKKEEENKTLTVEKFEAIMTCQNNAILGIN